MFLQEHSTLNWADVEGMYAKIDEWADKAAEMDRDPTDHEESGAQ
jgi:hypothetical protein